MYTVQRITYSVRSTVYPVCGRVSSRPRRVSSRAHTVRPQTCPQRHSQRHQRAPPACFREQAEAVCAPNNAARVPLLGQYRASRAAALSIASAARHGRRACSRPAQSLQQVHCLAMTAACGRDVNLNVNVNVNVNARPVGASAPASSRFISGRRHAPSCSHTAPACRDGCWPSATDAAPPSIC